MKQRRKTEEATEGRRRWAAIFFTERIHYTAISAGQVAFILHPELFPYTSITFAYCCTGTSLIGWVRTYFKKVVNLPASVAVTIKGLIEEREQGSASRIHIIKTQSNARHEVARFLLEMFLHPKKNFISLSCVSLIFTFQFPRCFLSFPSMFLSLFFWLLDTESPVTIFIFLLDTDCSSALAFSTALYWIFWKDVAGRHAWFLAFTMLVSLNSPSDLNDLIILNKDSSLTKSPNQP